MKALLDVLFEELLHLLRVEHNFVVHFIRGLSLGFVHQLADELIELRVVVAALDDY